MTMISSSFKKTLIGQISKQHGCAAAVYEALHVFPMYFEAFFPTSEEVKEG